MGHYLFGFSGRINRAKAMGGAAGRPCALHSHRRGLAFTIGSGPVLDLVNGKTSFAAIAASPQAHQFGIAFAVLLSADVLHHPRGHDQKAARPQQGAWWLLIFVVLPLVLQVPVFAAMPRAVRASEARWRARRPGPSAAAADAVRAAARADRTGAATIINLWAFVELYILRGTVGDNRFGPDPLAGR